MTTMILIVSLIVIAVVLVHARKAPNEGQMFFNTLILGLTAVVLIVNISVIDIETTRTLRQNWKVNLRPVILPSIKAPGSVDDYYRQQLQNRSGTVYFNIYNHIATNISGYIVANHQETKLSFYLSTLPPINDVFTCDNQNPSTSATVTWMPTTKGLCGHFDFDKNPPTPANTDNEIYIQYSDIDGNPYFTSAIDYYLNSGSLSGD